VQPTIDLVHAFRAAGSKVIWYVVEEVPVQVLSALVLVMIGPLCIQVSVGPKRV
jgi:hypothetical protein